jgi:hypothetical protein
MSKLTRREFFTRTGALALALSVPSVLADTSNDKASVIPERLPKDVGRKFNADGSVKTFLGNTFIGHIAQQGAGFEGFNTVLDVYREFPKHSFSNKVALLPPSSYHITVFGGANEVDRGTARWVKTTPTNMPISEITDQYLQAFKKMDGKYSVPFEFIVDEVPPARTEGTLKIPFKPANKSTEMRLRQLRDDLSELTGIREPDHDDYKFHLTLGYIYRFLSQEEAEKVSDLTKRYMERISRLEKKIQIHKIQFCQLQDMYAFEVLHELKKRTKHA